MSCVLLPVRLPETAVRAGGAARDEPFRRGAPDASRRRPDEPPFRIGESTATMSSLHIT